MAKLFTGVPPQHGSNDRCSLGNNQPSLKRSLFSARRPVGNICLIGCRTNFRPSGPSWSRRPWSLFKMAAC